MKALEFMESLVKNKRRVARYWCRKCFLELAMAESEDMYGVSGFEGGLLVMFSVKVQDGLSKVLS